MSTCHCAPYEGTDQYVFISYCRKDSDMVYPILDRMGRAGYRIWYDNGLYTGSEWLEVIAAHLQKSAAVMLFLTPAAIESHNCRHEALYAVEMEKPLVPVMLEGTILTPGMRMNLGAYQWLKVVSPPTESNVREILECPVVKGCRGLMDNRIPETPLWTGEKKPVEKPMPVFETGIVQETPKPEPEVPAPAPKPEPAPTPQPKPEPEAPVPAPQPVPEPEAPAPVPQPAPEPEAPAPEPEAPAPTPQPGPEPEAPSPAPQPAPEPEAPSPAPQPAPEPEAPSPAPQPGPEPEPVSSSTTEGSGGHKRRGDKWHTLETGTVTEIQGKTHGLRVETLVEKPPVKDLDATVVEDANESQDDLDETVVAPVEIAPVVLDPGSGKRYRGKIGETVLGRNEVSDIVIPDPEKRISKRHCSLLSAGEAHVVMDLKAPNGTFVNGERLESEARMKVPELFELGLYKTRLLVGFGREAERLSRCACLLSLESEGTGETRYLIDGQMELGRAHAWKSGALSSQSISHNHATIRLAKEGASITDHSRNGTWVNDQHLTSGETAPLQTGDSIRLGSETFIVRVTPIKEGKKP